MKITKREDGTLLVPKRIQMGNIIGDAIVEINPDSPEYEKYLAEYKEQEERFPA